MKIVVIALLIVHGLITALQSSGSSNSAKAISNPTWLNWWPTSLGQSWMLPSLNIGKSPLNILTGILWIIAGGCLIAAALGLARFIVPISWWRVLAGAGAVLSLVLFLLYAHPLFAVGIGANLAILIILLWTKWPPVQILGY